MRSKRKPMTVTPHLHVTVPKSLHKELAEKAKKENVDLETLVVHKLAMAVAQ